MYCQLLVKLYQTDNVRRSFSATIALQFGWVTANPNQMSQVPRLVLFRLFMSDAGTGLL